MPGFDREQWTTIHASRLAVGDVYNAHRASSVRPLVVVAVSVKPGRGDEWGSVTGVGRYVDNGDEFAFEYRANTSVTVRCDLRYAVKAPLSIGVPR
ncbi:hypothetical protein [Streptomyces poriferorum]|uniref:Uncharacterized protein n=1 Tax=Streptomyces poriferorum TaxID=2798799 RepID=A0ABY9J293_9ACTN|nr:MULTISPECIES: hypothetical protein [unclassified Streptomyces]MDP5310412.1 hypothetical protein [Streptomyces sp. Alt4]WLQ60434.1 hypothetical protein P8A19_35645 [Streptomyces sp. Alt2]